MRPATYDAATGEWIQRVQQRKFYPIQTVAMLLGVGAPSVYSSVKRGTLPAVRIGTTVHIAHDELLKYIETRDPNDLGFDGDDIVAVQVDPTSEIVSRAKAFGRQVGPKQIPLDFLDGDGATDEDEEEGAGS